MANTKISALTANTNPNGSEEFVYAYNNANGKITLNTMKSFVGGAGVTTLTADANIWELAGGFYETTHDLYYKSGEKVETGYSPQQIKQFLIVTEESVHGGKAFFVFNEFYVAANYYVSRAAYGFSESSSSGRINLLKKWDATLDLYATDMQTGSTSIHDLRSDVLSQYIENIQGSDTIELSTTDVPYVGVTYTIIINSVASGQNYTVTLGTGVTNPLGLTLPTSSTKPCVITVVPTSTTTAVITGCTIGN